MSRGAAAFKLLESGSSVRHGVQLRRRATLRREPQRSGPGRSGPGWYDPAPGRLLLQLTSAQLTGTLRLDAQANPNAAWLFKITSSLTTASNTAVVVVNGVTPCNSNNVTWQVGSSATVGTGTSFGGNVLAKTSITVNAGASSTGSLHP